MTTIEKASSHFKNYYLMALAMKFMGVVMSRKNLVQGLIPQSLIN